MRQVQGLGASLATSIDALVLLHEKWLVCLPALQAAPHCGTVMTNAIRAVHSHRQGCAAIHHLSLVACCRSVHCEVLLNVQECLALGAEALAGPCTAQGIAPSLGTPCRDLLRLCRGQMSRQTHEQVMGPEVAGVLHRGAGDVWSLAVLGFLVFAGPTDAAVPASGLHAPPDDLQIQQCRTDAELVQPEP